MTRPLTGWIAAALELGLCGGALEAAPELPLMAYQPGISPQAFLPVSYRCPPGKSGVVELTKMSAIGARIRVRVTFDGETATHAAVERGWPNKPLEPWHAFANPRQRPETDAERTILQATLSDADVIRMAVCQGVPSTREKYDAILEHNRRHLKPPAE